MSMTFGPDKRKRKQALKKIREAKKKWKIRKTVFIVLNLVSIFIVLASAFYAFSDTEYFEENIFFVLLSFLPASVVFVFGYLPWYYGRYTYTYPYGSRANAYLVLNEDYLTYFYWFEDKGSPAAYGFGGKFPPERKTEYIINKDDITDMYVDEYDICHIFGKGTLSYNSYTYGEGLIQKELDDFSFVIDFKNDDAKNTILNWRR